MKTNALSELEYSEKTEERAQTEGMEFDVPMPGVVVVTNVSHDSAHSVNVTDGAPESCSCKADQFGSGACKHRVACAIRSPVLAAASRGSGVEKAVATDGGQLLLQPEAEEENADAVAGCPHGNGEFCEGADADVERPELCWSCWEVWARWTRTFSPSKRLASLSMTRSARGPSSARRSI